MTVQKIDPISKIIVALDVPNEHDALVLASKLSPKKCHIKIGFELFSSASMPLVKKLQTMGFNIFLDLKLKDIPETVASAISVMLENKIWMTNLHADGSNKMMIAARKAAEQKIILIAVTVLTSMDKQQLKKIGVNKKPKNQVKMLAKLVHACKLDGVVASGKEVKMIKNKTTSNFLVVTPGIRDPSEKKDDQIRVTTIEEAIQNGADFVVIGRPITQSGDPTKTLDSFYKRALAAQEKLEE